MAINEVASNPSYVAAFRNDFDAAVSDDATRAGDGVVQAVFVVKEGALWLGGEDEVGAGNRFVGARNEVREQAREDRLNRDADLGAPELGGG